MKQVKDVHSQVS